MHHKNNVSFHLKTICNVAGTKCSRNGDTSEQETVSSRHHQMAATNGVEDCGSSEYPPMQALPSGGLSDESSTHFDCACVSEETGSRSPASETSSASCDIYRQNHGSDVLQHSNMSNKQHRKKRSRAAFSHAQVYNLCLFSEFFLKTQNIVFIASL